MAVRDPGVKHPTDTHWVNRVNVIRPMMRKEEQIRRRELTFEEVWGE